MTQIITRNFKHKFDNKIHEFSIEINTESFIPGADSLAYINTPDSYIASITIDNYLIILKPVGSCLLIDHLQEKNYKDYIPDYLIELLDLNAEFNLNNLSIDIEERNHFEYVLYKKENDIYREYSLDLHKNIQTLDSTIDSLFEELKTMAIYFIQGDFISTLDDFLEEEYLPPLAFDDFENFCDDYIPHYSNDFDEL